LICQAPRCWQFFIAFPASLGVLTAGVDFSIPRQPRSVSHVTTMIPAALVATLSNAVEFAKVKAIGLG
jgi:hypothetical protein